MKSSRNVWAETDFKYWAGRQVSTFQNSKQRSVAFRVEYGGQQEYLILRCRVRIRSIVHATLLFHKDEIVNELSSPGKLCVRLFSLVEVESAKGLRQNYCRHCSRAHSRCQSPHTLRWSSRILWMTFEVIDVTEAWYCLLRGRFLSRRNVHRDAVEVPPSHICFCWVYLFFVLCQYDSDLWWDGWCKVNLKIMSGVLQIWTPCT